MKHKEMIEKIDKSNIDSLSNLGMLHRLNMEHSKILSNDILKEYIFCSNDSKLYIQGYDMYKMTSLKSPFVDCDNCGGYGVIGKVLNSTFMGVVVGSSKHELIRCDKCRYLGFTIEENDLFSMCPHCIDSDIYDTCSFCYGRRVLTWTESILGVDKKDKIINYSGYMSGYSGVSGFSGSSGFSCVSGYSGVSGCSGLIPGHTHTISVPMVSAPPGYTGYTGVTGYQGNSFVQVTYYKNNNKP